MESYRENKHQVTELTMSEATLVGGGVGPAIALAAATVGHFSARGIVSAIAGRIGLGYAIFDAARIYGGGGRTSRITATQR